MKTENVFAIIVAVLAPCLAAPGQGVPTPTNMLPPINQNPAAGTNTAPAAPPEPAPVPLPADRTVSYAPLVGPDTTASNIAARISTNCGG